MREAADGGAAPVSVVIATRDRRAELLHTLERLTALPERPPVIVVDNGSRDGTATAVARRFPDALLVPLPRNLGAPARNIGVRLARTPYVAFSDDDSWWAPGALARAAGILDGHPRLGLLAGRVRLGRGGPVDAVSRKMASAPIGHPPGLPGPAIVGFPACAAVVRKDAFLAAGGFDELLFFGGEETLLAVDLAADGWDTAYTADVEAHHRPSESRGDPGGRWALHRRNDLLVCWMRLPLGSAARRTAALAAHSTHNRAAARALCALLARLPRALRRRRRAPREVVRRLRVLGELR
ncbi:glycosyltransferase family 2 protein [Streptomyces marincola]|uniref:glycosyltransferase family 2 protein n=1 Tax=Streptomyces marincola TaxID=2878388 RepID=UPI001CF21311|nr:glycosyltransferase [Streptomyces marincola]UCM88189.1 glycosyltransferase [Streptomyces marincola]